MPTSISGVARALARPCRTGLRMLPGLFAPRPSLIVATLVLAAGCSGSDGPNGDTPAVDIRMETQGETPDGASITIAGLSAADLDAWRATEPTDDDWAALLRVTVASDDDGDIVVPPVLGSYAIGRDGLLRFSPMFPFDPGRPYSVRLDPTQLPGREDAVLDAIVEVVELPRPDSDPTTVVERVFPSGDRMPENQLKLYLHFSAPMSDVNGLDYLSLHDARGRVVEDPFLPFGDEFWDRDHLRYTVFFDPGRIKQGIELNERLGRSLQDGESYALVVDPAWPDAEGNPLQAAFEKRFSVGPADMTPLDTATWSLRVPAAGTTQRLVVSFPEPLDHALMWRAIHVEDETGNRIEGEVEIGNWETRWTLTPSQPWVAGAHSLVALSIVEDLAGNRIGTPFEIDVFERVADTGTPDDVRLDFEVR